MARLLTDGWEMEDWVGGLMGTYTSSRATNVGVAAPPAGYGFLSDYCLDFYGSATGTTTFVINIPTGQSEFYCKFRFGAGVSMDRIIEFRNGTTTLRYLAVDGANHLILDSLQTSSFLMELGQCYVFQVYVKIADAGGRVVVYMDGISTPVIDYTGDTKPGAATTVDNFQFLAPQGAHYYLDDFALNDNTGGVDDSYPLPEVYTKITPTGNGTHNNWHGSDGNDVNNFELVDEFPKDDDTTYVYHDGTSGTQDQYAMSDDYDGTNRIITRVYAEARAKKTEAVALQIKLGIKPSGAADQMGVARDMIVSTYTRVTSGHWLVNPIDSLAWEESDIDALEGVIEIA